MLLLNACTWQDSLYHTYQSVKGQTWQQSDTLTFCDTLWLNQRQLQVLMRHDSLQLQTGLRWTDSYGFRDLSLRLEGSVGSLPVDQTVEFRLTDSREHWAGKGWGSVFTLVRDAGSLCLADVLEPSEKSQDPERSAASGSQSGSPEYSATFGRQTANPEQKEGGSYAVALPVSLKLTQRMQAEELPGIVSAGVRIHF